MRKKILLGCVLTIIFSGIVLASIPFTSSLSPSAKARADRPQYDISSIQIGDFSLKKINGGDAWDSYVLIIRDWNNQISVHLVPSKNNKIMMPDHHWGKPFGHYCTNFGPDIDSDNKLLKGGYIRCHDKDVPEWMEPVWVWSYTGKSNNINVKDMYTVEHEISGSTLYVNI